MSILKPIVMLLNREIPTNILIRRGLKVGDNFNRQQGCYIDPTHCYLVEIGNDVTMSIRVTLMAHDASTKKATGLTRIGRIRIGDRVFLGANVTVLPNVTIGNDAVIGAGSVVTKDIPAGTIAAGVPARVIGKVEDLIKQTEEDLSSGACSFDASYRMNNELNQVRIDELRTATQTRIAYID